MSDNRNSNSDLKWPSTISVFGLWTDVHVVRASRDLLVATLELSLGFSFLRSLNCSLKYPEKHGTHNQVLYYLYKVMYMLRGIVSDHILEIEVFHPT